jgi:hypothetical protein
VARASTALVSFEVIVPPHPTPSGLHRNIYHAVNGESECDVITSDHRIMSGMGRSGRYREIREIGEKDF